MLGDLIWQRDSEGGSTIDEVSGSSDGDLMHGAVCIRPRHLNLLHLNRERNGVCSLF
jgi:hypothetical protein